MKKTAILWMGADGATKDDIKMRVQALSGWTVDFSDSAESAVEHACAGSYAVLLLGKQVEDIEAKKVKAVFRAHGSGALVLSAHPKDTTEILWQRIRAALTQQRVEKLRRFHVQDEGFSGAGLPIRIGNGLK